MHRQRQALVFEQFSLHLSPRNTEGVLSLYSLQFFIYKKYIYGGTWSFLSQRAIEGS